MKTRLHLLSFIFLLGLFTTFPQLTFAYNQKDVIEVAAPPSGGIVLLRGYNSRKGVLTDNCLVPVRKTERGMGQPLSSNYRFVRSMEEVIRERSLDVSTKLDVSLGIGGASVGVEAGFYKRNQKSIDQGAAHAKFYDSESAVFASSRANYKLTDEAQELFQKSIRKGRFAKFSKQCGDAVVIGTQRARYFQGIASFSDKSSKSEKQKELNIKVAARYMGVQLGVGVAKSENDEDITKEVNITVDYIASGDASLRGGKSLKGFARAFSRFANLPKKKTFDVVNIFTIPYEKLLDTEEFDLGISGAHLRKVNRIIDGINLIGRAKNYVRGKSQKAKATRVFLQREYRYLTTILRRERGCIDTFSVVCKNLYERFQAFPHARNQKKLSNFVNKAVNSNIGCPTGYSVSTPTGKALCKVCASGKEPKFLNRREGRCDYLINVKKAPNSKRLFLGDLQSSEKRHIEAGIVASVSVSPNYCMKPANKCGKEAARAICQKRKFKDASNFGVWTPAMGTLSNTINRIVYPNGKDCKPKPDAFTPVQCKTFQFIDCVKK